MISVAVQNGASVTAYDENNNVICSRFGTLYGFTSTTFSVKDGNTVTTYDDRGSVKSTHFST